MPRSKTTSEKKDIKNSTKKGSVAAKKSSQSISAQSAKGQKNKISEPKSTVSNAAIDQNTKQSVVAKGNNAAKTTSPKVSTEKKPNVLQSATASVKNSSKSVTSNLSKVSRGAWFTLGGVVLVLVILAALSAHFLVVATVNNMPITRFSQYALLNQRYGSSATDELVTERLIEDQAAKKHVTVSNQEITQEINNIASQQGGMDQLNQVLASEGINQDELHNLVRLQLLEQKLFTVSDAEIKQYETQNKSSLPADFESSPSAKLAAEANIKNQLLQQKVQDWLNNAKSSTQVKLGPLL